MNVAPNFKILERDSKFSNYLWDDKCDTYLSFVLGLRLDLIMREQVILSRMLG